MTVDNAGLAAPAFARAVFVRACLPSALWLALGTGVAAAQAAGDGGASGNLRIGPFGLTPVIRVGTGFDTNVFNDPTEPRPDLTWAFAPSLDTSLKAGPLRLAMRNAVAITHYRHFSGERSVDTANQLTISMPMGRTSVFASGTAGRTRQRPGHEIDIRPLRLETGAEVGAEIRAGSRTFFRFAAARDAMRFDEAAVLDGVSLRAALNRTADRMSLSLRREVTPLTSWSVTVERQRDIFSESDARGSTILRVYPTVEFKPRALIVGRAQVGYLKFDPTDPLLAGFSGLSTAIDLASTIRDRTRLAVQAEREVRYSYNRLQPHYVTTGLRLSITHRLTDAWDVLATAGRQHLNYPESTLPGRAGQPPQLLPRRTDAVPTYGAGFGYQLTPRTRFALQVVREARRSEGTPLKNYDGTRASTSVTHAF
jgi:hypothetical protein